MAAPSRMPRNTDEDRRWAPVAVAMMKRDPKERFREALHRLLPDVSERVAFKDWEEERFNKRCGSYRISRDYFVTTVENLNFFDLGDGPMDYWKWQTGCLSTQDSPRVPLGSTDNALYRLEPNVFSLHSVAQADVDTPLVKPYCFLGINTNTNVSTRLQGRRQWSSSEDSQDSAESDETENGFMFHQLGEVTTWPISRGTELPTNDSPIHNDDWTPTGYVLVARLSTSGRAESLYLIYNTWPYVEDIGDRVEVKDPHWGRLPYEPNPDRHISFARLCSISSLLSDRDYHTRFEWGFEDANEEAASKEPVELVRLVEKNTRDGCLRLAVGRDGR